jgi:hypothetical protein
MKRSNSPVAAALAGLALLGIALYELKSGKALVSHKEGYGSYKRTVVHEATPAADPVNFWGEVAVTAGLGLYSLYFAFKGRE